jgi:hypothetical protein
MFISVFFLFCCFMHFKTGSSREVIFVFLITKLNVLLSLSNHKTKFFLVLFVDLFSKPVKLRLTVQKTLSKK